MGAGGRQEKELKEVGCEKDAAECFSVQVLRESRYRCRRLW